MQFKSCRYTKKEDGISPAYRVYREESYQMLRMQVKELQHDLRDYHEQKRAQHKKEIMSQFPMLQQSADTA